MPRQALDMYETPPHYLDALCHFISFKGKDILEPCVGDGAIADRLALEAKSITTNDLDPMKPADTHCDATELEGWPVGIQWCVTNPPFSDIDVIVRNMLQHSDNVVTLARLSFLEPTAERRSLFGLYGPPKMVIVLPRYCFRLNDQGKRATDSVTCAWLGWGPAVPELLTVWTIPPP